MTANTSTVRGLEVSTTGWTWTDAEPSLAEFYWTLLVTSYSKQYILVFGMLYFHVSLLLIFGSLDLTYEYIPAFRKYKIQPDKFVPNCSKLKVVPMGVCNILVSTTPAIFTYISPETTIDHLGTSWATMKPWFPMLVSAIMCEFLHDSYHYFLHRAAHDRRVYKYLHKVHHEYKAPFGFAAEYSHPIEGLMFLPGYLIGSAVCCSHVADLVLYNLITTWHGVAGHSGYDVWWLNPMYLIPGYAGPRFHDFHHEKNRGNFGQTFMFWDRLLGTHYTHARLAAEMEALKLKKNTPENSKIQ